MQDSQLESYKPLRQQLDLLDSFPYSKDWSAAADFLQLIADHCLTHKPSTVFECSSGLTTLVLARCCQMNGRGRVFSLENGEEYAINTRQHLAGYGLDAFASVIHAPLVDTHLKEGDFSWYATSGIPDNKIDMLVIDGPPGFIQKNSRFPALPLLFDRLSDNCTVFLDDAARDDEKEIVSLWQEAYPVSRCDYLELERGCAVLTLDKNGQ